MSNWYDEEGVPYVPESQRQAALKDVDERLTKAHARLKSARNYAERRDAEDDVAGAQLARSKIMGWKKYEGK